MCWDERLVPEKEHPPMSPSNKIEKLEEKVDMDSLIRQFSDCDPQMGLINNLYMRWADELGAGCNQCKELAQKFATSVDQAKHGGAFQISPYLKVNISRFTACHIFGPILSFCRIYYPPIKTFKFGKDLYVFVKFKRFDWRAMA